MKKILIPNENITLENVKKSNYWDLISIIVWNHYSEKKYQDDSKIEIQEEWYGKSTGGSTFSENWNNPNHAEKDYVRTLRAISISFSRSDFNTYIFISVETGNITATGVYNDTRKDKYPKFYLRNLDITNWLLENNFLTLTDESYDSNN